MFDRERWREVFYVLGKNKLRTGLTAFGVFWGIFMLVVMMGSGNGLENGVKSDFGSFATNSVFIWAQSTSMPYKGYKEGRSFNFDNADVEALATIPGVALAAPQNQLGGFRGGNNVKRGKYAGAFQVKGDIPEITQIRTLNILKGRFINQKDMEEARKVAVIGSRVRDVLFEPHEEPIGGYIEINEVFFQVVGVFDVPTSGHGGDRDLENIHIPFSTFQKAFNYGNIVGWFSVLSEPDVKASDLEVKVREVLKARHDVHPDDPRAIGGFNAQEQFDKMNNLFVGISALVWIVGIGTLMAGVIGVSNIMLIVVKERTKEIGIRKAIGATPASIITQILMESVVLTLLAGYFGLMMGVWLLELVNSAMGEGGGMFKNPEIDFQAALMALFILVVGGTLAGLIPARKAAAVDPIIALRSE